ncbi:MAG: HD domain-containing protein [Spirochaetales bacterium]|nr:HD domain-containing protein [Spirochaetales bacterium]
MEGILVRDLKVNSFFTDETFLDNQYILMAAEIPVSLDMVNRLQNWRFIQIYPKGELKENSAPPNLHLSDTSSQLPTATLDKTIQEKEKQTRLITNYFDLITFTEGIFSHFKQKKELNLPEITTKVKEMIEWVKAERDYVLSFTSLKHPVTNYNIPHSVNSALLAIAIGDYQKMPPHKIIELGTAALLHEIGMVNIPEELYMKEGALTEKEKKTMATHTLWGYRILKSFSVPENIAEVTLNHHERSDGTGYPRRLVGDNFSTYSRIVSLACSYDSCISKRPFKQPIDGHKTLLQFLTTHKLKYDDKALKSMVFCLSIFPLGTYVQLSDKSKGVVYKTNPEDPKFPAVKLLYSKTGEKIEDHQVVQTLPEGGLKIIGTFSPEELKERR